MFHLSRFGYVCSLLERLRTASILKNEDLETMQVCRCGGKGVSSSDCRSTPAVVMADRAEELHVGDGF